MWLFHFDHNSPGGSGYILDGEVSVSGQSKAMGGGDIEGTRSIRRGGRRLLLLEVLKTT